MLPSWKLGATSAGKEAVMSDVDVRRLTGAFGIAAGFLTLVALALYFAAGTPPKLEDTIKFSDYVTKNSGVFLTATLAAALSGVCFIVLIAGLRNLIRKAQSEYEWVSMLVFGVGMVDAALILVLGTLIGGATLDTVSKAEPTVVRGLFEGSILISGSVGLITDALLFASAGYAILGTGALPKWTGWASYAFVILDLVVSPSIYGGTDPSGFYTAFGYGPLILGTFPFILWLFIIGISMIVKREAMAPTPMSGR
jgi:hypothetical protein